MKRSGTRGSIDCSGACRMCGRGCGGTPKASRWSSSLLSTARATAPDRWFRRSKNASSSCCSCCASPSLLMIVVHAGGTCDHRVLPGIAVRSDPESRVATTVHGVDRRLIAAVAEPEAARAATVLRRIGELIPDRSASHLVPYNTTSLERDVALALGIPMYGADPRLFAFGTKTGCRRLFAEEHVRHPIEWRTCTRPDDVLAAVLQLREWQSSMTEAIVKLNEGVSSQGNALVDLGNLPERGAADERSGGATAAHDAVRGSRRRLQQLHEEARRAVASSRNASTQC